MTLTDVVMKLVGPVEPIGDSDRDRERFDNLKELANLTENLVIIIYGIAATNENQKAYSLKKAGEWARNFLDDLGIEK